MHFRPVTYVSSIVRPSGVGMVEQALEAGVMRFDTCARGRDGVLPSTLLAAIGGAGGDQASDEGAVRTIAMILRSHRCDCRIQTRDPLVLL